MGRVAGDVNIEEREGGRKLKVNVYLDDLRDCPTGCVIARTVEDALKYIRKGNVGILSLDHDLGVGSDGELLITGYDLVKMFCEEGLYVDEIYLHTDNSVGRDNMYHTLLGAQRRGFIDEKIKIYRYGKYPNRYSG